MSDVHTDEWFQDYVFPPGETLREELEYREMTQAALAGRMGRPVTTVSEIIDGQAPITPDTAQQLELVLGVPAHFWLALEQSYREYLARDETACLRPCSRS